MCVVITVDPIFSGSESILRLKIMFGRSSLYREYLVVRFLRKKVNVIEYGCFVYYNFSLETYV